VSSIQLIFKAKTAALTLIRESITEYGIRASPDDQDNYQRLWSRDCAIAGLAGLIYNDDKIIKGLKRSLLTLAKYQHSEGMIPSNVHPYTNDISYGSLVGRVDSSLWFYTISCLYMRHQNDIDFQKFIHPHLIKIRALIKAWEFNGKGFIYTPLSGNWADEYPIHGYTLYDNSLRIWGDQLYSSIYGEEYDNTLKNKIFLNFWPEHHSSDDSNVYHQRLFDNAIQDSPIHFASTINPSAYNFRFDAAANALALLLFDLNSDQKDKLKYFLDKLFSELSIHMIPAFWPCIKPNDATWNELKENYAYNFKNYPYQFHNGGIWPVWMGLFSMGLVRNNLHDHAYLIAHEYLSYLEKNDFHFYEYINSSTFESEGKMNLCYSASGTLFATSILESVNFDQFL